MEHTFLKGDHTPVFHKFIFNLTTGKCEMTPLFQERSMEFPGLNWDLIGYKTRYCYMSEF